MSCARSSLEIILGFSFALRLRTYRDPKLDHNSRCETLSDLSLVCPSSEVSSCVNDPDVYSSAMLRSQ
jgi:hypothetical protein